MNILLKAVLCEYGSNIESSISVTFLFCWTHWNISTVHQSEGACVNVRCWGLTPLWLSGRDLIRRCRHGPHLHQVQIPSLLVGVLSDWGCDTRRWCVAVPTKLARPLCQMPCRIPASLTGWSPRRQTPCWDLLILEISGRKESLHKSAAYILRA